MLRAKADRSSKSGLQKRVLSAHIVYYKVPVHEIPEGVKILWTSVAIVDVVGVFPDITGQQRRACSGQRSCCVAGVLQRQLAIRILLQPGPPRTEVIDRRIGELLFERINGAEGTLQG